jgi:beta-galactosidase
VSGQEQMHAGLNLPGLHEWSQGGREAAQVGSELLDIGPLPSSDKAPVAFVYDYEASWITRIQPQGQDFDFSELMFRWYEAVRKLGLDVDFVPPGADLSGYKLVVVPTLPYVSDAAERAFSRADGIVLYGPRTGSKTRHHAIPPNLPPGPLAALIKARVLEVSSLRPGLAATVTGVVQGKAQRWREALDVADAHVVARFDDGSAALTGAGNHHYLACWPDMALLDSVIQYATQKAGLETIALPEGIRLRRRGPLLFALNYGNVAWSLPFEGQLLLGEQSVGPQQVTILQMA